MYSAHSQKIPKLPVSHPLAATILSHKIMSNQPQELLTTQIMSNQPRELLTTQNHEQPVSRTFNHEQPVLRTFNHTKP